MSFGNSAGALQDWRVGSRYRCLGLGFRDLASRVYGELRNICVCLYIYIYAHTRICMYVCMYGKIKNIYIYIHTQYIYIGIFLETILGSLGRAQESNFRVPPSKTRYLGFRV